VLSYACGASGPPLIGATLGAYLDAVAAERPGAEAVVSCAHGVRLTYGDLAAQSDALARGLMALGVERGDRVAIWSTNCFEWIVAQFAVPKAGAILVNLNPAYRAHELGHALGQSGSSLILTQVRDRRTDYVATLAEVASSLPNLRTIVLLGDDEVAAPLDAALRWRDVLELAAPNVSPDALRERLDGTQFDDPANIQYTSGTTGSPKGATLSHHNVLNNGFFVGEGCRYDGRDRVCIPVPFYHCFGMVLANLACVTHGATMVIPGATFDPRASLDAVQRERCTAR
jgi:fatty-acyl-CoA synthase